jgi:hypothetical protein
MTVMKLVVIGIALLLALALILLATGGARDRKRSDKRRD